MKFWKPLVLLIVFIFGTACAQDKKVNEEWVARYDCPANGHNVTKAIALDASGNVYVTGTIQDSEESLEYCTIKYTHDGKRQWVARYNGSANDNDAASAALGLDAQGNVYVTGFSRDSTSQSDYTTIKYNTLGEEQWIARYNGTGNGTDAASALAVDTSGNVYVTGKSENGDFNYDYLTVKYTQQGAVEWVARYNGPANDCDKAYSLAVDEGNGICIAGMSTNLQGNNEFAIIKYDPQGEEEWVARYKGSEEHTPDKVIDIAFDAQGNIYVTGSSITQSSTYNLVIAKYSPKGEELWVTCYHADNFRQAQASVVNRTGNIYVTGERWDPKTFSNCMTIKFNTQGEEQWVAYYKGPGRSSVYPTAIDVDAGGNVYVTGWSGSIKTSLNYATIKYNSQGKTEWVIIHNDQEKGQDRATDITLDRDGNVYVTGYSNHRDSANNFYTIKYSQRGK